MSDKTNETKPILHEMQLDDNVKPANHREGLSVMNTGLLLLGQMAGIGILGLPKALADTGWGGLVMIIGACFISGYNGVHLGHCWNMLLERYPEYRGHVRSPYPAIAEKALGKRLRYGVSVVLNVGFFALSVVFLVLVSQNVHSLLQQMEIRFAYCWVMIIVAAIMLPLMWFGSPKDFWFVGFVTTGSSAVAFVLLFISFMMQLPMKDDVTHKSPEAFTPVFIAFGRILLAFGGSSSFPTIQHDMKVPSKFKVALSLNYAALLSVYLLIASVGYFINGNNSKDNILISLPYGGLRMSVEMLITLHVFFAVVVTFNPMAQEMEEYLKIPNEFGMKRVLLRSALVCGVLFVGQTIPHFGALSALVGGSTITLFTFIAPSVFYLCLSLQSGDWPQRKLQCYEKVIHGIIIVIGIFGGITSSYSAILEIVSPHSFVTPCYVNYTTAEG